MSASNLSRAMTNDVRVVHSSLHDGTDETGVSTSVNDMPCSLNSDDDVLLSGPHESTLESPEEERDAQDGVWEKNSDKRYSQEQTTLLQPVHLQRGRRRQRDEAFGRKPSSFKKDVAGGITKLDRKTSFHLDDELVDLTDFSTQQRSSNRITFEKHRRRSQEARKRELDAMPKEKRYGSDYHIK